MDSTNSTPVAQPPTADLLRSLPVCVRRLATAAGLSVPEFEQIAGIPRGRLVAGLADPGAMAVTDVILAIRAADIDCNDFWDEVEDGARELAEVNDQGLLIAVSPADDIPVEHLPDSDKEIQAHDAAVNDGRACINCGHIWAIGEPSRPAGFGPSGQLFRCSDRCRKGDSPAEGAPSRCIYCGRELGANSTTVGHDDDGHVQRCCGIGFGCGTEFIITAEDER